MNVAVAIRLARDVSKSAPDLLRPTHFRKGQIVRIEGPVHHPDEINWWGKRYERWAFWLNPDIDLSVIFGEEDVAEVFVWQGRCTRCNPREYVAVFRCPTCGESGEESEYEAAQRMKRNLEQVRKPNSPPPYYCLKCRKIMNFEKSFWREREVEPCDRCRSEYEEELEKFANAPWPVHLREPEETTR